ncbi:MAG TPA: RHS repeat-associated core domain-containing protein, partial [Chitinophagales bacterium]|nr:RHS repeat-associated core domain-containing protein [Chitinophagales bacterium]
NFQHCESGEIIDIYEAVYNSVNGIPGFGEPCEALEQLAGADLEDHFYVINSDLAWALYVNFYRSAKQKYLNAVAHYYAQGDVSDEDGEPDRFGINLSIGNDEFVAPLVYTYLSLDVDEYWYKLATNENYLPVIVRSILLQDKLVRFPDASWHSGVPPTAAIDGPEISELVELGTASTDAAYYSLTGNKPLAFDMETFLQGVLSHAEITVTDWRTADYPIEDIAGISERLYDALTERCLNEFDVTISTAVITNDLLTWNQETGCTPTETCTDNFLLLAATSAYDWTDDVVAFHNLIITDDATGEFTIEVFFNDAGDIDTVLASGVTCIPVNQNTFNLTSCDLTPTGNGAWGLLNYILLEPGIDINNTTGEVVDEALIDAATKAYLGDAPYYWKQIDYAVYELYNDANTHAIRFMIENTSGASTPFINDDDNDEIILSFEANPELGLDGYPVTEGYDQYFAFTQTDPDGTDADYHGVAYYRNIPGDEADFILYNYPIALCGQMYPFTQPCIEPEQLSAAHLSELFAELLGGTETFTIGEEIYLETPDAYPGWSPHLSAMMGATFGDDDEEFMYIQDYSSYAMTIVFKTETTIGDITLCTVTLEIPGDDAALTLEDISENIVLIAHEELGVGGTTHEFTLECNDDVLCGEDDLAITVWGHIDCIGLKNCPCENNVVDDYFFNSLNVGAQIGNGGGIGEIEEGEIETTPGTSTNCDLDVIYTPMLPDIDPCLADQMAVALNNAYAAYNNQVATYINNFEAGYTAHCLENLRETLVKSYAITEYHYTLYYYDQAGNLTMTVPPAGVDVLTGSSLDSMANYRKKLALAEPAKPQHNLATSYWYNSLNQLCKQKTPDAGISKFWYDYLGRIVLSQNAEQANIVEDEWKFSYTLYDGLGRIYEVGEITLDYDAGWVADIAEALESESNLFAFVSAAERAQVTSTYYDTEFDLAGDPFGAEGQKNLRNRIGAVTIEVDFDNIAATYDHATHYSYDIHGNVFTLVQDNPAMGEIQAEEQFKRIDYTYDLISGNVHEVAVQHDKADQFYQHYDYDADNRIYEVQTSRDGWIWEKEARYFYYRHGPLARVETGDLIVQGTDYAYTIQGWLKGVNAGALIADRDMGKDGYDDASNSHKYIAQDAFGFILDYFETDYSRINSGAAYKFIPNYTATNYNGVANSLYNGNIMSMSTALLQPLTDTDADGHHDKANVLGKVYNYDQLNRLTKSDSYEKAMTSTSNFTWADNVTPFDETYISQNWNTTYTYDANGNILTMQRAGNQNTAYDMDQLTYHYIDNTNQLLYVDDAITDDGAYDVDVDDQDIYNYTYDRIGNLTADVAEGIEKITWNVYGKIKKIVKEDESGLVFAYDATGNRISKTVIPVTGDVTTTYYVRDAQGNVMAVYTHTASDTATFVLTEQHIYGSSRIGMVQTNIDMLVTFTEDNYFYRSLGEKRYELSNHLGNVLSVISDRRLAFDTDANGTTNYFEADVISAQDYDPFGMLLEGRNWEGGSEYRFGFNGKENSDEIYGDAHAIDFGARIYINRLGRWMSVDPLKEKYPSSSTYLAFGNNPLLFVDSEGKDIVLYFEDETGKKTAILKIVTDTKLEYTVNVNSLPAFSGTTALKGAVQDPSFITLEYDDEEFKKNFNNDLWGNFSSDAKMISISGCGFFSIGVVQIELDLVTINKNSTSEDAGKTFAYFTLGGGLGVSASTEGLESLFLSGDVNLLKGNVDYKEDNYQNYDLDRNLFAGWSFQTAYSLSAYSKSYVTSYGTSDINCFVGDCNDEDLIYSAEMRGISVMGAYNLINGAFSGSVARTETFSWYLDQVNFLSTPSVNQTETCGE